jgi:SAM-dependent methyltransferase
MPRAIQHDSAAFEDQKGFYDRRFATGRYMPGFTQFYEASRVRTIRPVLAGLPEPEAVLDYGCGEGRYIGVLREAFPEARLFGCDVSDVAVQHASDRHGDASFVAMDNEVVPYADASFDLVLSVEVLEHVADVYRATREIGRVLRPGGWAVITTPCANAWSLEWVRNRVTGGLQPSIDHFGRFATDEPGHIRRLRSDDLRAVLADAGIDVVDLLFRGHLFTHLAHPVRRMDTVLVGPRVSFGMLDWRFFKHRRNGSTMVAVGRRRNAATGRYRRAPDD